MSTKVLSFLNELKENNDRIDDEAVESFDFLLKSVNIFNKMNPFNEFLNRALSS